MKILSLDVGDVRIGLAIGDTEIGVANSRNFLINDKSIFEKLDKLCKIEGIKEILVGHPLSLSGESTQQTNKTEIFIANLDRKLKLPVKLADERLTSRQAHANLSLGNVKAKDQKEFIDSEAARILLQAWIDKQS